MHGRYKRASVALTVLCTLLLPAVGSGAADQEDLNEIANDLEEIRDRIELHESQASNLKEKVETVSADITDLEVAINALNDEIEEVKAEASVAEAQINETEKEIDKVKDLALEQAVALYKGGTAETLDALLSSTSLGELNDRVQMLGIAAEENTGALIRYGRLKVGLEDQYDELFALQQDLNAKLEDREAYQAELETQKEELVADIATIREKLEDEKAEEAHKEEQYDDIRDQILAAQAEAASASSPTTPTYTGTPNTGGPSASGFVWPLNGAVTSGFGYRWGRMHEGIDIDGYTGQPIVATKAGRVISTGDAGDGYGTKVVIDHGGGFTSLYAHMSGLGTQNGASVSAGQVIGYVGCTGSCTGDHLHFEIRVNGTPQNPMSYLP
ncbi:MAG: peptidoglycan DD-metalloendopeptidase family protein [Actinomycetota bacterium]|nr:peptidoglycan DD-metalloendopeptidase family protein [Actinomycetota bacterium]